MYRSSGMIFGEVFRKGALIQAGHNFTHKIADDSEKLHKVYKYTYTYIRPF